MRQIKRWKICTRCGKEKIGKERLYCGSYKRKTGCSFIVYKEKSALRFKKWISTHKEIRKKRDRERYIKNKAFLKLTSVTV